MKATDFFLNRQCTHIIKNQGLRKHGDDKKIRYQGLRGGGGNEQAELRGLSGSEILWMILQWWAHVIMIHLSEGKPPGVSPKVNHGLWVVTRQGVFVTCN